MSTVIVIPSLDPSHRLLDLVDELRALDGSLEIVVVDDGSGPAAVPIFSMLQNSGVTVLSHGRNRGKGAALRTAFRYVQRTWPDSVVVTADSDGQHTPADILHVVHETERAETQSLVLGVRSFTADDIPWRSRIGNNVSVRLFSSAIGERVTDTQTGLRGFTPDIVPWAIDLPGDRFEYEAIMLLGTRRAGIQLQQVPIETVYLEQNHSSHFRPLRDSARVVAPLVSYIGSSLLAFVIDAALLWLFFTTTGWLAASIVAARVISASVNFAVNRELVFGRFRTHAPLRVELSKYAVTAAAILCANIALMELAARVGIHLVIAKIITEATLWIIGYAVQRVWVFARTREHSPPREVEHKAHIASRS
ncbi:MAG: bifunctional glycosyltransferase family 2/GtrA family protein [Microbacterium sp.]